MREIQTRNKREQRVRRQQVGLGILLIILLLGSTAGYAVSLIASSDTPSTGTGAPFFDGVSWIVERNGQRFSLSSSPEEVATIPIDETISSTLYFGQPVYISAQSPSIVQSIAQVISLNAQRVQEACYENCTDSPLPRKNCSERVIIWSPGEVNRVYKEELCVFIEGDIHAVDAFLYRILGII